MFVSLILWKASAKTCFLVRWVVVDDVVVSSIDTFRVLVTKKLGTKVDPGDYNQDSGGSGGSPQSL